MRNLSKLYQEILRTIRSKRGSVGSAREETTLQNRLRSATKNFAVARKRIQSRDVWHQRIVELGVLAETV
jgi:hypothetical protein